MQIVFRCGHRDLDTFGGIGICRTPLKEGCPGTQKPRLGRVTGASSFFLALSAFLDAVVDGLATLLFGAALFVAGPARGFLFGCHQMPLPLEELFLLP